MRTDLLRLAVLLAVAASLCAGQQPKAQPKAQPKPAASATATGVFVGRSGKPMVGARIMLAEIVADAEELQARLKLVPNGDAVADSQGRFELKGFRPGIYALVYQPAGASALLPAETGIKALFAVDESPMPLLHNVEIGKGASSPDRVWGRQFTLLKGHTFFSKGRFMNIWNASIRRNPGGPHMEMHRGTIWVENLADKSQLKFEAWSY
jgi:hypothetical protein